MLLILSFGRKKDVADLKNSSASIPFFGDMRTLFLLLALQLNSLNGNRLAKFER